MRRDADGWIAALRLQPHPEGGHFAETYRSADVIPASGLPPRFGGPRACSTAIYFLLKGHQVSRLHRLKSDEMWHFYAGSAATVHVIESTGTLRELRLGPDLERGESLQVAVSAGCWFGATVEDTRSFTLMGCTVSPGFAYEDFELGDRQWLMEHYPQHRQLIERLTTARVA
ncbi:MAG TPA: cupin domain-containing protein [Vicinamibacterales bacterium]|jgi:hypothetical protein